MKVRRSALTRNVFVKYVSVLFYIIRQQVSLRSHQQALIFCLRIHSACFERGNTPVNVQETHLLRRIFVVLVGAVDKDLAGAGRTCQRWVLSVVLSYRRQAMKNWVVQVELKRGDQHRPLQIK
jgi:hypothetical protein